MTRPVDLPEAVRRDIAYEHRGEVVAGSGRAIEPRRLLPGPGTGRPETARTLTWVLAAVARTVEQIDVEALRALLEREGLDVPDDVAVLIGATAAYRAALAGPGDGAAPGTPLQVARGELELVRAAVWGCAPVEVERGLAAGETVIEVAVRLLGGTPAGAVPERLPPDA